MGRKRIPHAEFLRRNRLILDAAGRGLTLYDIGTRFDLTRQRVSQILQRARFRLPKRRSRLRRAKFEVPVASALLATATGAPPPKEETRCHGRSGIFKVFSVRASEGLKEIKLKVMRDPLHELPRNAHIYTECVSYPRESDPLYGLELWDETVMFIPHVCGYDELCAFHPKYKAVGMAGITGPIHSLLG